MEPSAVPTMGSAGAAPAGLDSTAHSVSLPLPVSRHTVTSIGLAVELPPLMWGFYFIYLFIFSKQLGDIKFSVTVFVRRHHNNTNGHFINLLILHSSHSPLDSAVHQHQYSNLNSIICSLRGLFSPFCGVMLFCMKMAFVWCFCSHAPSFFYSQRFILCPAVVFCVHIYFI